ncbi:MAG: GntP family permease [Planctomycetaceae bacterium]
MTVWWLVFGSALLILVAVLYFKTHALLALLAAGLLVAVLTPQAELRRHADELVASGDASQAQADALTERSGPKRLADAFGDTAGQIGIMIALASVVGICLLESGAARTIIDHMLRWFGAKRAPEALAASAFILSIPVFFDTVFYLMVPLARSLRASTGKDYVLYVLAIMAGGSIAHSLVPPTPGPLQFSEIIGVDLMTMIIAGTVIGSCSSFVSLGAARLLNRWTVVPLRSVIGEANHTDAPEADVARPPLWLSLLPILTPVFLIALGALNDAWELPISSSLEQVLEIIADKNVAMGIATVLALYLLRYSPDGHDRGAAITRALGSGGQIILITAAGGAFGAMLRQAGIAPAVSSLALGASGPLLLVIVFLVTASIRTLQGSATVAMITAAGVLQGLADVDNLPFHPVYVAMAIGAGSKPISWMTDSGFWIMCKMSGMTDAEGLRTVSPLTCAMGLSALFWTLLFSWIYPGV